MIMYTLIVKFGTILCFVDEFRQGTEYRLVTLINARKAEMMANAGKDKTAHTVQDTETNEGMYWQMILSECVHIFVC